MAQGQEEAERPELRVSPGEYERSGCRGGQGPGHHSLVRMARRGWEPITRAIGRVSRSGQSWAYFQF